MNLSEWTKEIHANACEKGWWTEERSLPEILMLCVSELAEALEEYRDGKPMMYYECDADTACGATGIAYMGDICNDCGYRLFKPEGISVELCDCIIRILDYCGHAGIDIEKVMQIKHEYNLGPAYRHGGKIC